jgi:carotenoid cleavage dioxygenase-like enzyme
MQLERIDTSNFAPITIESDIERLPIVGELPRGLNGTLFRNGPNPQFPSPHDHWFAGDGMIHAFTLTDGQASYRNRWVRTAKFEAERAAGHPLFAGLGEKLPGAEAVADQGVANTNIVWHAGRLLALEEAHLPIQLDPATLATLGPQDLRGALQGPFTAHPKLDPISGELVFFGYSTTGELSAGMTYGTIDASGVVTRFERFEAPYSSMVHDFIVTDRHVLFPILPLTGSMERATSGRPPFAWEPDKGAFVGVMKRGGPDRSITWFRGEACFVFHVMNAWEDGDCIVADVMQFEEPPLFPRADGAPTDPAKTQAKLTRWRFDLGGGTDTFQRQQLDDVVGEFPRCDERRAGLGYRHGYLLCTPPGQADEARYNGIGHIDLVSGQRRIYALPPGDAGSEPVFVPRVPGATEGDVAHQRSPPPPP